MAWSVFSQLAIWLRGSPPINLRGSRCISPTRTSTHAHFYLHCWPRLEMSMSSAQCYGTHRRTSYVILITVFSCELILMSCFIFNYLIYYSSIITSRAYMYHAILVLILTAWQIFNFYRPLMCNIIFICTWVRWQVHILLSTFVTHILSISHHAW
jgi:hypothetical protein